MIPDFSNLSTFQLAGACRWKISNLRQKSSPEGRLYFVDLNGQTMKASDARKVLIAHILAEQAKAGLPIDQQSTGHVLSV